jgi:hypothetical protein
MPVGCLDSDEGLYQFLNKITSDELGLVFTERPYNVATGAAILDIVESGIPERPSVKDIHHGVVK